MSVPRELDIALNGPVCPQLLRSDAIVVDERGWYRILTPSSPWAADNEILFSNLDGRNVDKEIETVVSEYQSLGRPLRWCVYPWTQPADLGERLLKLGASDWGVRAFLCNTSLPLELVEGTEVEQVDPDSTAAYDAYMKVMSSGWHLPADEASFRRQRYRQLITGTEASMQLFIARHDGQVTGCGATVIKEDSAYLTLDYVIPAYQARGVFQSLIAFRLQVLRDRGIALACGHGREQTSAPWLDRFGFKSIYPYRIYQLDPPSPVGRQS